MKDACISREMGFVVARIFAHRRSGFRPKMIVLAIPLSKLSIHEEVLLLEPSFSVIRLLNRVFPSKETAINQWS